MSTEITLLVVTLLGVAAGMIFFLWQKSRQEAVAIIRDIFKHVYTRLLLAQRLTVETRKGVPILMIAKIDERSLFLSCEWPKTPFPIPRGVMKLSGTITAEAGETILLGGYSVTQVEFKKLWRTFTGGTIPLPECEQIIYSIELTLASGDVMELKNILCPMRAEVPNLGDNFDRIIATIEHKIAVAANLHT